MMRLGLDEVRGNNAYDLAADLPAARPDRRRASLWYSEFVKNITVSLPDDVYRNARITAAERDTSVSALVREHLEALSRQESDYERRKRLQREVLSTIDRFSARDRLDRDRLHERDAVR